MELTATELWSNILVSAKTSIPEQSFKTWLSGTLAVGLSDDGLQVEAPSQFHIEWIEDKYGQLLHEALEKALGRTVQISFNARKSTPFPQEVPAIELAEAWTNTSTVTPIPEPKPAEPHGAASSLNDRYTFDRFVVGTNNQLASAACHAVAEKPAKMYNPLFLYGGVGLGKTHLMHAIGNRLLSQSPANRVAYVPCEQFMNELVSAIQNGSTSAFRRRYRQMDLLLVDDVHFLEGKERTQEEFFHTFNALYDARKQIVLASDRPPKDIPGLEARLVSRFEWGLVVDLKAPDYETRVAILRKKASDDSLTMDDEVIDFIARSCKASVRELEGAVIKLLAYSSLTNRDITLDLAQTALQGMLRSAAESQPLSPDEIKQAVASRWEVQPKDLRSKRRTKDVMVPRQVAMFLIRELLDLPLARIGDLFGGRDHSTVIHSIDRVAEQLETDDSFRVKLHEIRESLKEDK